VKSKDYIPDKGDVVWISMNPQAGHEQAGRRPALVLSPTAYNGKLDWHYFVPSPTKSKVILLKFLYQKTQTFLAQSLPIKLKVWIGERDELSSVVKPPNCLFPKSK